MTHPSQALDEVVHQRNRLGILSVLAEGKRVQFGFVQEILGLTDGNLSRHLQILEDAGYVEIEKGYEGRRARTWAKITRSGRRALDGEMALLASLMDAVRVPNIKSSPRRSRGPQRLSPRTVP